MARKQIPSTPAQGPRFTVLVATNPDQYVAADGMSRTEDQAQAYQWSDEAAAITVAKALRGTVMLVSGGLALAPSTLPEQPAATELKAKRQRKLAQTQPVTVLQIPVGTPAPQKADGNKPAIVREAKPVKPAAPKTPKGPPRDEVVKLLQTAGLVCISKSSDHWVAPEDTTGKGPRLVLPKSATVTRIFLYKMEAAVTLLGYKTPDQRKSEGLGAVTHVADVVALSQVQTLITAVCEVNGIQLRQDGKPRAKRSRKATPANGVATEQSNGG